MKSKISDSLLIRQYQSGNEEALEQILERHQEEIYTSIYYKVLDENLANDIFQDTFVKIILNLRNKKYKEEGKFLPWAKRIANNMVMDHFRRKSKRKFVSETTYSQEGLSILDSIEDPQDSIEEQLINFQINEDLIRLVHYLPENQQEIIRLRFFVGLSFKEIAEQEGSSINTMLGRLRYALINLRKLVKEHNITLTR